MFEIHIALPVLKYALTAEVIESLRLVGLSKSKYFLGVYNLPADGLLQACTPPTGHDLEEPGVMTSSKNPLLQDVLEMVTKGMVVLRNQGIAGNFEIEELISTADNESTADFDELLPQFQRVPDAPAYENHIIWKGTGSDLPANEKIVEMILLVSGVKPHQIVDFAYSSIGAAADIITRVATIYQPNRRATLLFGSQVADKKDMLGFHHLVNEKVHMVGEWRHEQ